MDAPATEPRLRDRERLALAAEEVLEEASISMREDETEETEVEKFREFLDQVTPEDFKSQ